MKTIASTVPSSPPQADGASASLHRSGAVARMLRLPVATLRVWERRYGLTQAALTPGGQRLYSADDVRRLALVKQLTDLGHAIGSLAMLDMPQLQRVASTHAQALATTQTGMHTMAAALPAARPWRLVVIGAALAPRLQRPALRRGVGRPLALLGPFDDVAQAAAAVQGPPPDALLFQQPQLQPGWLAATDAAAPALAGLPRAVLYRFAADPVCEALAAAGVALLREPQPDVVVAQWLRSLSSRTTALPMSASDRPLPGAAPVPPRRWDDAALADFANLPPTMACECPRHLAELLVQLAHFEAYSTECAHRNTADAELHGHLRQLAAASRAGFEAALEHVALHEGLPLPAPTTARDAPAMPVRRAGSAAVGQPRRSRRAGSDATEPGPPGGV